MPNPSSRPDHRTESARHCCVDQDLTERSRAVAETASCCPRPELATCCAPEEKAGCCGPAATTCTCV
jgi:hypothetical protein